MSRSLFLGHASTRFSAFKYEDLDLASAKPSIRLAIILPGTRESKIRVTLAHTTFADRPRYEALSYTWGKPDVVKGIELNGQRVDVRENLWEALLYLRSATQERALWVDAICINQSDIEERNHQVRLMAHIYTRAKTVLVWLGTNAMKPSLGSASISSSRQRQVGVVIYDEELEEMCSQPYWRRVWIVQEIGAATELRVHWRDKSIPWDDLFSLVRDMPPDNIGLALKLAQQRENRHGDSFLLANLIEVCKDSLCEEPRDKIYGLVSIAHDCQDGSFPMDYSKPLFEVYQDVMRFLYPMTRAGIPEKQAAALTREEIEDMNTFQNHFANSSTAKDQNASRKENMKTVLHSSQLIQEVLGGPIKMREDFYKIFPKMLPQGTSFSPFLPPPDATVSELFDPFRITAVHTGYISSIGPYYSEVIGVPDSIRKWKAELPKSIMDIEQLRKKNEGFMRVLLGLNKTDLAKIFSVDPRFSWKRLLNSTDSLIAFNKIPQFKFGQNKLSTAHLSEESEPRLFLTKTGVIGLMPPGARQWDMVYQFWHSDSVAIVRKDGDYLKIVGRAVVANNSFVKGSKFHEPEDDFNGFNFHTDGKEVYMDLRTLQLMTQ